MLCRLYKVCTVHCLNWLYSSTGTEWWCAHGGADTAKDRESDLSEQQCSVGVFSDITKNDKKCLNKQ